MADQEQTVHLSITVAARRIGLEPDAVRYCVEVGLISERLTEAELVELRRVRRLTELGVNMPGVEVILHMRRRMEQLQAELARLRAQMRVAATQELLTRLSPSPARDRDEAE